MVLPHATTRFLDELGWQPWGSNHSFLRYERMFGMLTRLDTPVHSPGHVPPIPSQVRQLLHATLGRTQHGMRILWLGELKYTAPGRPEVPLWLLRDADVHVVAQRAYDEMTKLEAAMQLGWEP
jgi:hypothetical protein